MSASTCTNAGGNEIGDGRSLLSTAFNYVTEEQISPRLNEQGETYIEIYEYFPSLSKFYFDFEKNFHGASYVDFAHNTWPRIPLILVTLYILMIVVGSRIMKEKEGFVWKHQSAMWNLALALFSFCGMCRTVPHLLHSVLSRGSVDYIMCGGDNFGDGAVGLWVMLFIFSKIPELGDTVFLVFRKKKLMLLHWYHHISVLLFCWHSYANRSSTGLYFVAMNYTVHAVMYFYYFLMCYRMKPKWFNPQWITIMQISQMVIGSAVSVRSYYLLLSNGDNACQVTEENVFAGLLIYTSYLYLFSVFFIQRFLFPTVPKGSQAKAEKTAPNTPVIPSSPVGKDLKDVSESKEPLHPTSFDRLNSTSRLHRALQEIDEKFPNLRSALSLIETKDEETQSFLEHLTKVKGVGN
jgi:elongation of very long chain fatty acids protein 6